MVGAVILLTTSAHAQTGESPAELTARVTDATAILLAGEGVGRLASVSTAVVVRPDGMLLAAWHSPKNAREVQVRFKTGETDNRAVLVGVDERRDAAAIRISAGNLTARPTGAGQSVRPGIRLTP
jgi:S1-C subfamily serine protease